MTLEADELLARISQTLRSEIGPAVADEYTRTQTFMAAVILERLSKQLALAPAHAATESSDIAELIETLTPLLGDASEVVTSAMASFTSTASVAALSPLIEALYDTSVSQDLRGRALAPIRAVLRRDIDRRMQIAT